MITKAIIVSQSSETKFKVSMPIFNNIQGSASSTPISELAEASVCLFGNFNNVYQPGDVVFVGFEDHDASKPVILGKLYTQKKPVNNFTQSDEVINSDITVRSISVEDETNQAVCFAKLPENTTIGKITKDSINALQGLSGDNLERRLQYIEEKIESQEVVAQND